MKGDTQISLAGFLMGFLNVQGQLQTIFFPCPLSVSGNIKLELIFTTDAIVRIVGDNAVLNLHGQAEYVEDFR